eukprot:GFYU01004893.1.p1 GENE.GFYU01004893.1~~GFYU01004893.1.p1  ORF type:complete len:354 (-),score=96.43 GFYU01004893.1:18-1079(-)
MSTVNWGIVGSSNWSDHTFGPAICAATNAKLLAVLGTSQEKVDAFKKKHGVERGYLNSDSASFFQDPDVQAVWICSSTSLHFEIAMSCLNAHKHVLIEKPMASNPEQCEKLLARQKELRAEGHNLVVAVGYHNRYHPTMLKYLKKWQDGDYGVPVNVRTHFYAPFVPNDSKKKKETSDGGWAIHDVGTHLIDQLSMFSNARRGADGKGSLNMVGCSLSSVCRGYETDDHAVVLLKDSGHHMTASMETSTGTHSAGPRLEVYGSTGYFVASNYFFGGGTFESVVHGGADNDPATATKEVETAADCNLFQFQVETISREVMAIAKDTSHTPSGLATGEDGHHAVLLIHQAIQSTQ